MCGACGLQLQYGAPTPPQPSPYAPQPQGYPPPPPPQYGYPPPPPQGYMPPGMPYGGGYMMVPMQGATLPSAKWAKVGGIMNIVTSSIYLLLGLLAAAGASEERGNDKDSLMLGVMIFLALGVAGIIFGVYSTRGKWGGALGGGILHSLLALICFIGVGAIQEVKEKRSRYDYYDSYYRSNEDKGLEAAAGVLVLFALLSTLTAIFCYVGIGGAKRRAQYEQHMRATGAF